MASTDGVSGFFTGIGAVFAGLKRIATDGALRNLTLLPLAITIAVYVVIFGAGVFLADDALALIWSQPAEGFLHYLWYVAVAIVLVALVALLIVSFVAGANVIAGPFYEKLAEKILDSHHLSKQKTPLAKGIAREIAWSLTFAIPAMICGLLALIPAVGLVFAGIATLIAVFGLAGSAIGPALSATGQGYGARITLLRRKFALLAGVGVVMSVSMFVPVLGLIAIPSGIVGATEALASSGALSKT